jgi:hypothetical protein
MLEFNRPYRYGRRGTSYEGLVMTPLTEFASGSLLTHIRNALYRAITEKDEKAPKEWTPELDDVHCLYLEAVRGLGEREGLSAVRAWLAANGLAPPPHEQVTLAMREAVRDLVRMWRHPQGREAAILMASLVILAVALVLRLDWIGVM